MLLINVPIGMIIGKLLCFVYDYMVLEVRVTRIALTDCETWQVFFTAQR